MEELLQKVQPPYLNMIPASYSTWAMFIRAEGRRYRCATGKCSAASPGAHLHPVTAAHLASAHARAHPVSHHSSTYKAASGSCIQDA